MIQSKLGIPANRPLAHTINAVVQETGCGRTKVYEAIKTGQLKARKIGRRTVILDQDLRCWLTSLPTLTPAMASNSRATLGGVR